jgi:hypothetical protein
MINRLFVVLVISLCIFSLSFHFIVEGLGGVHDHFVGRQAAGISHSHEGDQFVLGEMGISGGTEPVSHSLVTSDLHQVSQPLPPPFHPPKSF